ASTDSLRLARTVTDPQVQRHENAARHEKKEPNPQQQGDHRRFRKSRNTVSASPIFAMSGNSVSDPFSRLVPSTSSYPLGTWRPFNVVPSELRSIRKNRSVAGSLRMRACSRETSGDEAMRMSTG